MRWAPAASLTERRVEAISPCSTVWAGTAAMFTMVAGRGDGSAGISSSPTAASCLNGWSVSPALTQLLPSQATLARGR